jgi:hypothetical protein
LIMAMASSINTFNCRVHCKARDGEFLQAEIAEKQALSIKYQMTIAKLPLAKDIDDFDFDGATVNKNAKPPIRLLTGPGAQLQLWWRLELLNQV